MRRGGSRVEKQGTLFEVEGTSTPSNAVRRNDNAIALFALASIRGVGFATVKALCDEFRGELTQAFKIDEQTLTTLLYDARTPNPSGVAKEIKTNAKAIVAEGRKAWTKYESKGVKLLFREQPEYPASLLDLASPPSWLFVEGDAELLSSPFLVGFVGTRTPTTEGQHIARRASAYLAQMNAVILSGLAEGIDTVGHQSALLYGAPTVAVLGHGIDVVFPASTAKTRQDIVLFGGAVISEYLPGDNYSRDKFVHRNRIQAALSRAVCFVEAREKSGTAHTLRFAKHMNRPLFATTFGGYRGVPEEELLHVLESQGGSVFDLAQEADVQSLSEFVHKAFTQQVEVPDDNAPMMFRNIAREVRRLAEEYGATSHDLDWLKKELTKIPVAPSVHEEPKRKGRQRKGAN